MSFSVRCRGARRFTVVIIALIALGGIRLGIGWVQRGDQDRIRKLDELITERQALVDALRHSGNPELLAEARASLRRAEEQRYATKQYNAMVRAGSLDGYIVFVASLLAAMILTRVLMLLHERSLCARNPAA